MRCARCLTLVATVGMTAGAVLAGSLSAGAAERPAEAAAASNAGDGAALPVIVLLADQHGGLSDARGDGSASPRALADAVDQGAVLALAARVGARSLHPFSIINGFAATMTPAQQQVLRADPAVSAVVPDAGIRAPAEPIDTVRGAPATSRVPGTAPTLAAAARAGICPSRPSSPLLEPEALQVMHAAGAPGGDAQAITTGKGVKVAFLADGLDVDDPDFVRADGTHVIAAYKDFSGDGLDAATDAREAFGDASALASQGRRTYDLAGYVNPAHPLPAGCTIRIRGIAPGASLLALKVIAASGLASTTAVVQAIQYAVQQGKVDVLSESLGGSYYPDLARDPVALADEAAVDAGVTVVASTGDAGVANTEGTPASAPGVIAVAGTTTFRAYAQTTYGGIQLGSHRWVSDNISALSSGGVTQIGATPTMAAPADLGWSVCSPAAPYQGCADFQGRPAALQLFGGTSQAAPFVAGAAALVIAAYTGTHHGARPSPALVRRLLAGTATDLGHPADEQGAGLVDALAAVRAARSVAGPSGGGVTGHAPGAALLVDHTQLDLSGRPGSATTATLKVTNVSARAVVVTARTRTLARVLKTVTGARRFTGNRLPRYVDAYGDAVAYLRRPFTVAPGADRLAVTLAYPPASGQIPAITLLGPHGALQAYSLPEGLGGIGRVEVRRPAAGVWTMIVSASPKFSGRVAYRITTAAYTSLGRASAPGVRLAPGATGAVTVRLPFADSPRDVVGSVQLSASDGATASVPVVLRSVLDVGNHPTTITGTIDGGDGRPAAPAETDTWYLDVPAGRPWLTARLHLNGSTAEGVQAFLVAPDGQTLSTASNLRFGAGTTIGIRGLYLSVRRPAPGRWHLLVVAFNPVAGVQTAQAFQVVVASGEPDIAVVGHLPGSPSTTVHRGATITRRIRITNTTGVRQLYFADPRRAGLVDYRLASQVPGDDLASITLPSSQVSPDWLVPAESAAVGFAARASVPVQLDAQWQYSDPEQVSSGHSRTAALRFTAPEVSPGFWEAFPGEPGPNPAGGGAPGTAALTATARSRAFDAAVTTSTGDYWRLALVPGGFLTGHPLPGAIGRGGLLRLDPGRAGYLTVTITVASKPGTTVRGTVFVDTYDSYVGQASETAAVPYGYTVR